MTSKPKQKFLIKAAYAPSTLQAYSTSFNLFLSWCRDQGEDPQTWDQLDSCFVDWLHDLYIDMGATGSGKSIAVKARQGLLLQLPQAKEHLRQTAIAIKGWNKIAPTSSYPPLSWDLACVIAVRMVLTGNLRAAVGVLLAFDCYLRVGELCELKREDIADVKDSRLDSKVPARMHLRLRHTKTGPNKWVYVEDQAVAQMVRLLLDNTKPGRYLLPYSTDQFRQLFKSTCAQLGLSSKYVPHSLRHGGATRDFMRGVKVEDIMLRGRWASSKSARTYIQSGPALLLATKVPADVAQLGRLFASDLVFSLSAAADESQKKTLSQRH